MNEHSEKIMKKKIIVAHAGQRVLLSEYSKCINR